MKKYLRMSDFIVGDVSMSMNHNGDASVQYDYADPDMIVRKTMDAMEHAINSHDELVAMNKELLAALEEAKSVLSSINTGRQHKVEVEDDEPAFWQRNEWVTWAKGEILPMIEAAIAKAKGGAA